MSWTTGVDALSYSRIGFLVSKSLFNSIVEARQVRFLLAIHYSEHVQTIPDEPFHASPQAPTAFSDHYCKAPFFRIPLVDLRHVDSRGKLRRYLLQQLCLLPA